MICFPDNYVIQLSESLNLHQCTRW